MGPTTERRPRWVLSGWKWPPLFVSPDWFRSKRPGYQPLKSASPRCAPFWSIWQEWAMPCKSRTGRRCPELHTCNGKDSLESLAWWPLRKRLNVSWHIAGWENSLGAFHGFLFGWHFWYVTREAKALVLPTNTGAKNTFYPEIPLISILWKMRFQKCEFC